MSKLSPFQRDAVIDAMRSHGELALAADAAGVTLSYLKRVIASEPELADEVDHARAVNSANYVIVAQQVLARDPLRSVGLLQSMLEAKVEGFSSESRKKEASKDRPTALRLRQFDDNGVEDTTPKEPLLISCQRIL